MQFGMSTLIETKSLDECAALCDELGLDFIELNMNLPQYQADQIDIPKFSEIAEKFGIYYTIHLDENLNPCDFNRTVANAYVDTVMQTIDIAKRLNIPVLNMHLSAGVYFTLPDEKVYLFDEYEGVYLQTLHDFRDKCDAAIGSSNIKICIENCSGYNQSFLLHGLDLLLESSAFALTLDIGHNHCTGYGDEEVIMQRAKRLCHMHIHDAILNYDTGSKNDHLPLGDGELDLPKYFNLANECGCRAVLETKTIGGLKKSVEWIRGAGANRIIK